VEGAVAKLATTGSGVSRLGTGPRFWHPIRPRTFLQTSHISLTKDKFRRRV